MAKVIVFDVNETLLDMSALDPHFERLFGSAGARQAWFQQLKEIWLVGLVTNQFIPFSELAGAALRMTAEMEGISLTEEHESAMVGALKELPPHEETSEALGLLREGGEQSAGSRAPDTRHGWPGTVTRSGGVAL